MELPFATQQPAIFLNQSIVTPCLKPANDFSLHKIKFRLLTFIYKVRTGWFGSSNLSLFAPLFIHSRLVFSGPLALGPLYLYSSAHTLLPNLFMIVCYLFRSQFKWQSFTMACSDYHGQSRSPHSLFWHDLNFSSSKPLSVSEISLFVHMCIIYADPPKLKFYEF